MSESCKKENPSLLGEKLLSIEVTTHCNIQCLHCFVTHQINEKSSLSFDVVRDIIKEGYDIGYRRLHFTGGEPLLWKELFEALDYAFFLGYRTVLINSNGILLSKDVCTYFANYNGVVITVSLDGPEELHNRIRGEGAHRLTMQGIENALNAAIEPIIFTSLCKSLLPELPYFAKDIFNRFPKIKYLSLIPIRKTSDNGFALSKELLDPGDFVQLVRAVSLLNVLGLKIDVLNEPLVHVVSKVLERPFIQWSDPMQREGSLIIMANRIMSNSHFSRAFFGLYEPGIIKKVLVSNEYKKSVSPNETVCPYCAYDQLCKETGMVQPSEFNDKCSQNGPYCQDVLDMIVPEK